MSLQGHYLLEMDKFTFSRKSYCSGKFTTLSESDINHDVQSEKAKMYHCTTESKSSFDGISIGIIHTCLHSIRVKYTQVYSIPVSDFVPDFYYPGSSLHGKNMNSSSSKSSNYHVRALYSYLSSGEHQLSFHEGDIIVLIGERNKGWQYGENLRNHR